MSEESIEFHWLATISVGSMRTTREGTIGAVPGVHTRQSTVMAIISGLKERHGDNLVVLYLSLEPNQIPGAGER